MTLVKRIAHEKRVVLWPLVLLVAANVAAYAAVVHPLERRAEGAAGRAANADAALRAAERDLTASKTLVTNQKVAREELATFYDKVLPQNFVEARSMTYKRLPELAKKANVRYEAGSFEIDPTLKNTRVGRLHAKMILEGDYESFREFVYDVETASDFIIIDSVTLAQGEAGKPLTLNLELSTYFRIANGT